MRLIMFSKMLQDCSPVELIDRARQWGLEGYDLCVRPDYPVNPDNVGEALPQMVSMCRDAGLEIPMVTGNFDLLEPEHPTAEPILRAMDKADVRLLKLGYFKFDPGKQDYVSEVERVRAIFKRWEPLASRYHVKVCYHTHSNKCMGLNAAAMAHLLQGFDPELIGAYIDPAHLLVEGEDIDTAIAMLKPWLSIVAVKDVLLRRVEKHGHGSVQRDWVVAGKGMVDWSTVFAALDEASYRGPISVHCEFRVPEEEFLPAVADEIAFFKEFVQQYPA